ncbi:MAG: beta strand repeat-containing protein, partial [Bacteroidota bacterium]
NTGAATALASNGTANYTYQWNTGATTSTINNLTVGTYTVTATDANGCTATTTTNITQPTLLSVTIPSTTNVLCNGGNTGAATASSTNGTSGYTYLWNTGATTSTISNLTAGTFTVTTTDANGCTATTTTTITQPILLSVAIPSTSNVLCNGGNTGSATASASNGASGYSYQWNTGATTSTINNLMAGTYTVTVTDANGCVATISTILTQPAAIVLLGNSTSTLCGQLNGSANIIANGGVGAFSYLWSNGGTTTSINNVASGGYVVTVTDANGCSEATTINVGSIGGPTVAITSSTNVSCYGGTNGSAQVLVSAGTGPFTYAWLPSGGNNANATNLPAGNYSVNVTDINGCTSSASIVISQPAQLSLSIPSSNNVLCNGGSTGSITASASNGTAGYTYLWNTGATTSTINNLTAGTYTITATDANGCTATTNATITQPTLLSVAIPSTTNVLCNGGNTGAATASASNGTAGYTYSWNTGATTSSINNLTAGTYTVTATDANGCTATTNATITQPTLLSVAIPSTTNVLCNGGTTGSATASASNGTAGYSYLWNTGATTSIINSLTAGTYTVTATDANGCIATTNATITQPTLLSVAIPSTTNVLCNGGTTGSATASASNGTASYTYQWNTGATTSTINNLTAGTYTVTATDMNGCTIATSIVIGQPTAMNILPGSTQASCSQANGSASVNVTGGTSGYSYLWSNGQTTSIINNVLSGVYSVTVTDANGCTSNTLVNVGNIGGPSVSIANSSNVSCFGGANGSAQVNVSAGFGPYTYAWSPTGGNTATATNLTAGNYSVNVVDANGCLSSTSILITQPTAINIQPTSTQAICGQANGSASVNVSGGVAGYNYSWSSGQTTSSINNLTAGVYTITVTDNNGCSTSSNVNVGSIGGPTVSIASSSNVSCFGGTNGSAQVNVSAGTGPFTYTWSPTGG